ncbi:amino acid adenylation domain-containing protein [Streptomyces sannanensis]|uniref:amino acid adenylation domain-containing protein n=1 Tax=Streptomyces sannanensis TaxID=285536 RepID=UPI0031E9818B
MDFNEFSARTTLAQVVAELVPGHGVYRIDAAAAHAVLPSSDVPELATACAAELAALGVKPEVVLGYCSAASLSLHLARALSREIGHQPRVHLVEPTWLTSDHIREDVQNIAEQLTGNAEPYAEGVTLAEIDSFLQVTLRTGLLSQGLSTEEIEICLPMLAGRYRTWFGFLLQTLDAPLPSEVLPESVVISQDGRRMPHPSWREKVRVSTLARPSGDLLGSPEATDAIRAILSGSFPQSVLPENGPPAFAEGSCIDELLRTWFDSDAPAVSDMCETISYRELARRADALALRLSSIGVRSGTVVGIQMERSVGLVVAIIAVLLARGSYLPLDSAWPAARIRFIVEQSKPSVVLCADQDATLAACTVETGATLLALSELTDTPDPEQTICPGSLQPGNDAEIAYIIYTSGSTGSPKGVEVPHRGLVNRIRWMQEQYPIGPGDSLLQKTPITFDVSLWEVIWPLSTGARLVMAVPGGHRDPEYIADVIRDEGISVVHFVPSMLGSFLMSTPPHSLPTLRHVFCSGEALSADLANRFTSDHDAALHNLYGPAEASIEVTHWTCRRPEPGPGVPIGVPIRGVHVTVRDEAGKRTAIGEPGELYLGGVCLAQGYLGRPDLTERAFVYDSEAPGLRLYRTGDLVRWSVDGHLEYLGRNDDQIKLHGQRIEPIEIEAAATSQVDVDAALAMIRTDQPGPARLILYVTPQLQPAAIQSLRNKLADRLPPGFLPTAIVSLASFPTTSNGKLDRHALPVPDMAGMGRGSSRRRRSGKQPQGQE